VAGAAGLTRTRIRVGLYGPGPGVAGAGLVVLAAGAGVQRAGAAWGAEGRVPVGGDLTRLVRVGPGAANGPASGHFLAR
jgi:hypothetical protein